VLRSVPNSKTRKRLQELQARIEALQKQLESLQREMEEVRLYIEEQAQETIPVIQTNLAEALRFRPGNYIQFQWFDSQENRANEGFQLRRFRISQTNVLDPRTQMRLGVRCLHRVRSASLRSCAMRS
jgi:predicted nuclease with TOPRIM domain